MIKGRQTQKPTEEWHQGLLGTRWAEGRGLFQLDYAFSVAEAFDPEWTTKAYDLQVAGVLRATIEVHHDVETEVAAGPCPRCDDQMQHRRTRTAVVPMSGAKSSGLSLESSGGFVEVGLVCSCLIAHQGAPEKTSGCGAHYTVYAGRRLL